MEDILIQMTTNKIPPFIMKHSLVLFLGACPWLFPSMLRTQDIPKFGSISRALPEYQKSFVGLALSQGSHAPVPVYRLTSAKAMKLCLPLASQSTAIISFSLLSIPQPSKLMDTVR